MNPAASILSRASAFRLVRQYPLASFFVLAYLYSGICRVPVIFVPGWPGVISFLATLGPAFAALTVWAITGERDQAAARLRSLLHWKVHPGWYLAALLLPPLMIVAPLVINQLIWGQDGLAALTGYGAAAFLPALVLVLINFVYMILIVWGEELGWRGFALPRLQARLHPLAASALLGLIWGLWHLPSFWIPGSTQHAIPLPVYLIYIFGHTFLYSWIYNGTRGSLLLACLHHASTNAFTIALAAFPLFTAILDHPLSMLLVVGLMDAVVILASQGNLFVENLRGSPPILDQAAGPRSAGTSQNAPDGDHK